MTGSSLTRDSAHRHSAFAPAVRNGPRWPSDADGCADQMGNWSKVQFTDGAHRAYLSFGASSFDGRRKSRRRMARKVTIMRPTTRTLAIGFGLAVAVMASAVWAQRGGGSRGGQSAGFSQGGGGHRGGSHQGWHGSYRGWSGGHAGWGGRHGGHGHGGHSHGHGSLYLGFTSPFWYGSYGYPYAYPYYPYPYTYRYSYPYAYSGYYATYGADPYPYYPPGGVVSEGPAVYVERTNPNAARGWSSEYWHYCRESNLYYPYARECAGQWEQVPVEPQSAER